ncbi:MAG TPA: alpha-1,4-glucan--maltose-1-phosphate maltosyltransferase [Actinomycetota bacterium]|nr:alpha-1,4-glucan--maltose-1-phosphate maltosyltransferase [Actinomycetota bacterium]
MNSHLRDGHAVIEGIRPEINGGRYRAKAIVGDVVEVSADIFRDGPDMLAAVVRYKGPGGRWTEAPMTHLGNDRWAGAFSPDRIGVWRYAIEAWTDRFGTWRRTLEKKLDAGQDVAVEIEEGALLIEGRVAAVPARSRNKLKKAAEALRAAAKGDGDDLPARIAEVFEDGVADLLTKYPDRTGATVTKPALELTVDRPLARAGAWYEFFPRSVPARATGGHGTFKTAAKELRRIADMGFDVVYLPPIHPIGTTARKGRNNTLDATPDDVGVPWAIGAKEGGHTAVHPQLGSLKDFDDFRKEAERLGLELALDFAIQASPDHPWVNKHPEWFHHRPDGSIKFAENPPKQYQDIYPINFDLEEPHRTELWNELKGIIDFWLDRGVKIFRVDNPHTKPFAFWEWLIAEVKAKDPEVIFLAEAFTKPVVMRALAKLGFTQSYTYFTWRNYKWEIIEYLNELTQTDMADYFRPNFFANTPDILHEYLQHGGPPAFKVRLVLAALLSPTYGIYSGYELFENTPIRPGSEEYLNSEKYELKPRDYSGDNLIPYITRINEIRRKHPVTSELTNLYFHDIDKEHLLAFSKTRRNQDALLVVVNLNPWHWEEGTLHLNLDVFGFGHDQPFEVHDLITDTTYMWRGPDNYVRLDPFDEPAHIFRVRG